MFLKWVEFLMSVKKFAVLFPDKDETSVRVDKARVHQRGEHTWRAGGSGESSRTSDEWSRWCFLQLLAYSVIFSGQILLLSYHITLIMSVFFLLIFLSL